MAIALTGTGGLFTRLGKIFAQHRNVNGFRGELAAVGDTSDATAKWGATTGPKVKDLKHAIDEIAAQYASARQDLIDQLYSNKASYLSTQASLLGYLQTLAKNTLITMADDDAVLISRDLPTAMAELIRQMNNTSDTVKSNTVSVSVAAATVPANTGNSTCVASVVGPNGKNREYVMPETLEAKVTSDFQGNGTLGAESLQVRGEVAAASSLDYNWPDGSGSSSNLTVIDPTVNGSGSETDTANMLTNSDFDTFTVANTPDNWAILAGGVAGTDIFSEASIVYRSGGKALKFLGTGGAPLSSVAQTLNPYLGTGTNLPLKANGVYAINWYARKSSASLLAGVLEVSLVDGSNTIIQDDAGNDLKKQVAFGTLTTSYAPYNFFASLPKLLPAVVKIRVRMSTAATSGESVYVDDLAMAKAVELYPRGPYASIFRGSTDALLNDQWNITVSQNNGGIFQTNFDAFFDMRGLNLQLPSAGSPTIAESLVG